MPPGGPESTQSHCRRKWPGTSPRRSASLEDPLPEESGEEEGDEEEAPSMGEQASMDEESVYAPSSPAGDEDQEMGLLSTVEVCPILSHSVCEEEYEEFEDAMEETCALSVMLGDTRKGFRARAKAHTQATVAEVYSPPRVTRAATMLPSLGIEPGAALDITTCDEHGKPWDFSDATTRSKAERLIDDMKPDLLVGSPECVAFSPWQRLNRLRSRDPDKYRRMREDGVTHLKFVCHLYAKQVKAGRYFLHEHPAQADSWTESCIQDILGLEGVDSIVMHQCQLGQCDETGRPVKKPTRWMSNSSCILNRLNLQCTGVKGWCSRNVEQEKHRPAFGKVAKQAAIYPFQLCRAILEGLKTELVRSGRMLGSLNILGPLGSTLDEEPLTVVEELDQILASL